MREDEREGEDGKVREERMEGKGQWERVREGRTRGWKEEWNEGRLGTRRR